MRADPAPSPERVAFLGDHIEFGIKMLHVHHEGEDALLYPKLIERVPEQAATTEEVDHERRGPAGRRPIAFVPGSGTQPSCATEPERSRTLGVVEHDRGDGERHDGGFAASRLTPEELAWGVPAAPRTYWPARAAVLAAMSLYLVLPDVLIPYPRWIVPTLEGAVLLALSFVVPHRTNVDHPARRLLAIVLIGLISAANTLSLGFLIHELLHGGAEEGRLLIFSSIAIWLTNVIAFALWYWELDRGGPFQRHKATHREPDFLFPQMTTPGAGRVTWSPGFMDYLYVSLTNATAFSPTDTMPLTVWAKSLMAVQSIASLLTVAVVAARAVNILT